jgi:hypothetical protein
MGTFEQLSNNKGTVSTALGKALARQVLVGQTGILMECIDLASYEPSRPDQKHIRAGAAKVVEIVAETRPDLVAPFLEKLLPACSVEEPQTRWMVMRTMGFCAHLNKAAAQRAIVYDEKYIDDKDGLILASSADLFLGDLGAISKKDAHRVFPILAKSMEHVIENEQDWLLEALYKVYPNVEKAEQETIRMFAEDWQHSSRKSTQQRAKRILKISVKK